MKTTFLRDTEFSNVNNLFSTRYVRNTCNAGSTTPFIVLTDSNGTIAYSSAVAIDKMKRIDKAIKAVAEGK